MLAEAPRVLLSTAPDPAAAAALLSGFLPSDVKYQSLAEILELVNRVEPSSTKKSAFGNSTMLESDEGGETDTTGYEPFEGGRGGGNRGGARSRGVSRHSSESSHTGCESQIQS